MTADPHDAIFAEYKKTKKHKNTNLKIQMSDAIFFYLSHKKYKNVNSLTRIHLMQYFLPPFEKSRKRGKVRQGKGAILHQKSL